MKKKEFCDILSSRLSGIPDSEREKTLQYYSEMIDDRTEDGLSEDEAVAALGSIDTIVSNILSDQSFGTIIKTRVNDYKNKSQTNTILLILVAVLGFPIWFPLVMSVLAILFSVYVTVWALIFALFAVVVGLIIGGLVSLILPIALIGSAGIPLTLCMAGSGLICISLALFLLKPISIIIKALIKLTADFSKAIKRIFIKKGGN